jgi:8-oxo-dGTP pyrophosphatase MutT (NUDIX family)
MSFLIQHIVEKSADLAATDLSRFQPPKDQELRKSAILLLFGETNDGLDLTFIQRSTSLRHHPGQIAFPGGMMDSTDENEIATALREAQEEIALEKTSVNILGVLPNLFVPVSEFIVTPVLAHWHSPHEVFPNDLAEVERVERIPLSEISNPNNRVSVRHSSGFVGPAFNVRDFVIWGFTGGLLDRLLAAYELEEDWDSEKIVDLDPRYS